jgi:hypothetical protein
VSSVLELLLEQACQIWNGPQSFSLGTGKYHFCCLTFELASGNLHDIIRICEVQFLVENIKLESPKLQPFY